jgi:hypothetical protein
MADKIELNGYDYSKVDGKFVKKSLFYKEPDPTKPYAHGEPTTVSAAQVFLKNYWNEIKDNDDANTQPIAFTFGKENLLALLAQEDCVGIKFYLGKRLASERPDGFIGKWEGKTLVAIGIKNLPGEPEIGAERDYIARGIDETAVPKLTKDGDDDTQPGLIIEAIPPFTITDIPKP